MRYKHKSHFFFLFALVSESVYIVLHWQMFISKAICLVGKATSTKQTRGKQDEKEILLESRQC